MHPTFMLPDCYNGPKIIARDNSSVPMCHYNRDMVQINEMNTTDVTIAINNVWTAEVSPQQVQVFIHTGDVGDVRRGGDGFQCLDNDGTDIDVDGENELNLQCYQEEPGNPESPYLATVDIVITDRVISGSNNVRHSCFPDEPVLESCSWRLIIPCDRDELCTNEPTTQPSGAPTLNPTEKPTESCPEYVPPECPEDIIVLEKVGVTPYPDDSIRVLSQDTTSVTVELKQSFAKSSSTATIDHMYFQYMHSNFDTKCSEEFDLDCNSKIEIEIECMRSKPIALFELWVADNDVLDSTGDNAIIPECCHPDDAEGKPAAMYLIEIKCATACPEELQ